MTEAVLCLIADPSRAPLKAGVVEDLARRLGGKAHWLAPDEAVEIVHTPDADVTAIADEALGDNPVDRIVVPAAERKKRLLLCDMDSTVITVECVDELADFAGVKPEVAEITRKAMNGELDFEAALRARVALLEGLPEAILEEVMRERVRLMPGATALVRTLKRNGATTALVSGGFTFFTERVAALCGFDVHEANRLEIKGGVLSGRIGKPIRGAEAKLATFERLRQQSKLEPAACCAVGDGANDLPMLRAAGLGVAFRAHPKVAEAVPARIRFGDLTAILYLMGIEKAAFAG